MHVGERETGGREGGLESATGFLTYVRFKGEKLIRRAGIMISHAA